MRDRVTPEVILTTRRKLNAEGHKLTYRRLASLASECSTVDGVTYADSSARKALLAQATSQFLRTKRSKAMGHPNGDRRYTSEDRANVDRSKVAKVHGARPSTRVTVQ